MSKDLNATVGPLNVPSRGAVGEWLDALEELDDQPAKLVALEAVADAARAARIVLKQIQVSWLPRSHNVRVALGALDDGGADVPRNVR